MNLRLDSDIFEIVKNGSKDVEIRLNDEKRQKLNIGDKLIFANRSNEDEKIEACVVGLDYYKDFLEVSNTYEMKRIYKDGASKEEFNDLAKRFYSDEEISKYGIVAISFKKNK